MSAPQLPFGIQQALEDLRKTLENVYQERLRGLYLYGSYARGDFHPDSDVDVLVVLEGQVHPSQEIDRISDLVADICLAHHVLIATFPVPEEWLRVRKSPLFEQVRREGILL